MPIKGLTTNIVPSFPILGKIRKGTQKQGNKFGEDLEYFRFDAKNSELQAFLESHYTNAPNHIPVHLPYPKPEDNFPCWLEDYTTNRDLKARCDGENIVLYLNKETQQYSKKPFPCLKETGKLCNCKEVGRLNVILPKVLEAGHIGYFILETHSKHDIVTINQFLGAIYQSTGNLTGIPMILSRYQREVSVPYFKDSIAKRTSATKNLVMLSLHPELVKTMTANNVLLPVQNFALIGASHEEEF